jgi:hypothetical protein
MNYQLHYDYLIERAKQRIVLEHTENHHIIPRCLGGTSTDSNLVKLTPEEHFLAHQLLVKIYPNDSKIVFGAFMLSYDSHGHRINNKLFGWLRRRMAKSISIINRANAKERTKKSGITQRGKILSPEHKQKLSDAGKRRIQSEETKTKQSISALNRSSTVKDKRLEMHKSEWYRSKLSNAAKNKKWMIHTETRKTSFVSSELVDEFLSSGWVFGRSIK